MKDIIIKGAREHNLKNIDVKIPRDKLIVITGVSGSGKSSIAFDTLYAEGQRRYVESLSAYARQFIGQMEKPKVDHIEGLSPAISIEQKTVSRNPRSTVATVTEIYDYLRILYARAGTQYCHICGKKVSSQSIDEIILHINSLPKNTKIQILAPVVQNRKGEHKDILSDARASGFSRAIINGQIRDLSEDIVLDKKSKHTIDIIIDRLQIGGESNSRLADSIETAMKSGNGNIKIHFYDQNKYELISSANACADCGIGFEQLSPHHFSFNSPLGFCPECNGLGTKFEFNPKLLIPDTSLSLLDGALKCWSSVGDRDGGWTRSILEGLAKELKFSLKTPWKDLPKNVQDVIFNGLKDKRVKMNWQSKNSKGEMMVRFEGVLKMLERRMKETTSESMKKYYMQFISDALCTHCNGQKLRPEFLAVKFEGKSIFEITDLSVRDAYDFFKKLKLTGSKKIIADEVIKEILSRLSFLLHVGLHYLSLDRKAPTLSGGESQRIRLASQIGSGLVGVMYILDEPSIGLHQRDNERLIGMLQNLKKLGNTVIVVEHDEEMIRTADEVIDFGPGAGILGGKIIAQGSPSEIIKNKNSLTGKYLSGKLKIERPKTRRKIDNKKFIEIQGATQNNLKSVNVKFPLGVFTCVTGVSGSGKSSLMNQTLYPALSNKLMNSTLPVGSHKKLIIDNSVDKVIAIDQQPIGRTPRSNPATYTKLFDEIRILFSKLPEAETRGYTAGRFSFNVKGGRCEACEGDGVKRIEMHFLADVYVTCDICHGKRYNNETLEIRYKDKNIADVLDMDVQEAYKHFENIPSIKKKLQTLIDVGLDYIKVGQQATTLSGGEAQRVKLAKELSKIATGNTVYILDEPTTGLHFDDVRKLLTVLQRLVDAGNTIIVLEHNLDVVKCADHIIDMGPEGGYEGGEVLAIGTPEEICKNNKSLTGKFLKQVLN